MTEQARKLIRSLSGRGRPSAPFAPEPSGGPLVAARIPPAGIGLEQALRDRLTDLLTVRATELGLTALPHVEVWPADRPAGVSVDGHPLTLIPAGAGDGPQWVDRVAAATDRALRRQLSVLVGDLGAMPPAARYLLDHGHRPTKGEEPGAQGSDEEIGESLLARTSPRIVLQVAEDTLRNTTANRPRDLAGLRTDVYRTRGVQLPDVRLVPTHEPAGTVRITLNDITMPIARLGADAGWTDVVRLLGRGLSECLHWFVQNLDIKAAVETMSYALPDLVTAYLECYPDPHLLTACVRALVREERPVRNLPRIMWLLVEVGGASVGRGMVRLGENPLLAEAGVAPAAQRDVAVLVSRIRKCVAEDSWRVRVPVFDSPMRLPVGLEDRITGATGDADQADAEWAVLDHLAGVASGTTVVVSTIDVVRRVQRVVRALPTPLRVIADQELPPDVAC